MNVVNKVAFPRFGNYHVPVSFLIKKVLNAVPIIPPNTSRKTLEIGAKHAPDFICVPFKFTLGSMIEALEMGANVIIGIGGTCRLSYYPELQQQILTDLGYKFKFINTSNLNFRDPKFLASLKEINPEVNGSMLIKYWLLAKELVKAVDQCETFIRSNVGFEVQKGSFDKLYNELISKFYTVETKDEIISLLNEYMEKFKNVEISKPKNCLRVGVIGEYYTIMEPYSNHFIERELAENGIEVFRNLNVSSTFFADTRPSLLKNISKWLKFEGGASTVYTINDAKEFAEKGFDGIVHLKSFGCTPETDMLPVLQNISNEYNIPILYLSFDTQTSETGIKTRLEAFIDMLQFKNNKVTEEVE